MSTAPVLTPRRGRPPNPTPRALKHRVRETQDGPTLKDFLRAPQSDLRIRYRETLTKSEALEELARFRSISQIAAEEINQRLIPDEDQCLICKKVIPHGMKVTQMVNLRDDATGTIQTKVLCSINCVREYNKTRMGLAELIK